MKISVKVIARAKKERIKKLPDGSFKIWVNVVAEKGRANERVRELLSEYFGKAKSNIEILSGHSSNNKIIEIN